LSIVFNFKFLFQNWLSIFWLRTQLPLDLTLDRRTSLILCSSSFKLVTMASMASALPLLPRYLSASPLLMLLLFFVLSSSIHHHHHPILALAASSSSSANNVIQCRSGWTNLLQTLHPSQINDGYCDFPYDNADEPNTSACSGGMDGMWVGLPMLSTDGSVIDETSTKMMKPLQRFWCLLQLLHFTI